MTYTVVTSLSLPYQPLFLQAIITPEEKLLLDCPDPTPDELQE
jgi:hypothetical protein